MTRTDRPIVRRSTERVLVLAPAMLHSLGSVAPTPFLTERSLGEAHMKRHYRMPSLGPVPVFILALILVAPATSPSGRADGSSSNQESQGSLAASHGQPNDQIPSLVTGPPTFGQPTISGIQGVGFEQDIRLDPRSSLTNTAHSRAI